MIRPEDCTVQHITGTHVVFQKKRARTQNYITENWIVPGYTGCRSLSAPMVVIQGWLFPYDLAICSARIIKLKNIVTALPLLPALFFLQLTPFLTLTSFGAKFRMGMQAAWLSTMMAPLRCHSETNLSLPTQ
jgi:hypothetical protein